jgi:uncharacterized protein (DUF58 family)
VRSDPAFAPSFRWRFRAWVLLGGGVLCLAAGVAAAEPALLFLAVPLLLAPLAAAVVGPHRSPRASVDWAVEGGGREVRIVGTIGVSAPTDARDIEVEVAVPPGLVAPRPARVDRGPLRIQFSLDCVAPDPVVVPVPPPALVWRDPAGLVDRTVTASPVELVVERYPPELVHLGAVRLERTIALPGEVPSRRIGQSGEFYGVREAIPTDPPNRINWNATARVGRWLANEYLADRTGDLVLLLDARPSTLGPRSDAQLLSLSAAAAQGIADSFLRAKARVGLGIYGEFLTAIPLGSGRAQRVRIRRALLGARVAKEPGPTERGAVALQRYFPPGVTTILLTSLADEETGDLVPYLRRRGFPVVILSPSPLPLSARARRPGAADPEEIVSRIARLNRRTRVARAWRDAPVVDWEDYWSLAGLVNLLRRPGRRTRGTA